MSIGTTRPDRPGCGSQHHDLRPGGDLGGDRVHLLRQTRLGSPEVELASASRGLAKWRCWPATRIESLIGNPLHLGLFGNLGLAPGVAEPPHATSAPHKRGLAAAGGVMHDAFTRARASARTGDHVPSAAEWSTSAPCSALARSPEWTADPPGAEPVVATRTARRSPPSAATPCPAAAPVGSKLRPSTLRQTRTRGGSRGRRSRRNRAAVDRHSASANRGRRLQVSRRCRGNRVPGPGGHRVGSGSSDGRMSLLPRFAAPGWPARKAAVCVVHPGGGPRSRRLWTAPGLRALTAAGRKPRRGGETGAARGGNSSSASSADPSACRCRAPGLNTAPAGFSGVGAVIREPSGWTLRGLPAARLATAC